jgi:hypothetical protein
VALEAAVAALSMVAAPAAAFTRNPAVGARP